MKAVSTPFVFLDADTSSGSEAHLFENPIDIITTTRADEIEDCLAKMEHHARSGAFLAGFFSYEAGYVFEPKLRPLLPEKLNTPLLWFGAFKVAKNMQSTDVDTWLETRSQTHAPPREIDPTLSQKAYEQKFNAVRDYIEKGDIYQANLTFKGKFGFTGCPFALYESLRRGQQTAFGGMIQTGDVTYLSLSPELFFSSKNGILSCRPMKGTAKRGITTSKDQAIKDWLKDDQKSQAENLMIVDLMRNDMSRISQPGSVGVTDLYSVETYPTLHQMTSGITSRLKKNISISDVIKNMFPCGSVTGAPKHRAMEIINELEDEPRGIYTGSIGLICPNGNARFNVAIRTLRLKEGAGEIGIGSGIVADSNPLEEYSESLLKMRFLKTPLPPFDLLETLKWDPDEGYSLLDFHLERLAKSALYFGYPYDRSRIDRELSALKASFHSTAQRVRLLLDPRGNIALSHTALPRADITKPWSFIVSDKIINSNDPFFYHKTTHRQFYDNERERQKSRLACDEVIFQNEKGEITEGSFTNIFIRRDGQLLTPARTCGLLDGTLRRKLLERDTDPAIEARLTIEDLQAAEEIYLGNSVRGLVPAKLAREFTPA